MHFLTRLTLTTVVALTLFGKTTDGLPGWLRPDYTGIQKLYTQVVQEHTRHGDLAEEETLLQDRVQGKAAVVVALADGRMTLPQAAGCFREWMKDVQAFWNTLERTFASGSTDEKLCRYVIDWTRLHLEDDGPVQANAVAHRLQEELDELLRAGSPLIAP